MNRITEIEIAGRRIGCRHPPYVVAELSANHNGDLDRALAIVEAAARAGADAVKLQTYTADTMTIDHDGPGFRIESGLWKGRGLYELYREAHTPWEWHEALFARARALGMTAFSTPFDESAVDFLEGLNSPAYKIASFELVDLSLIEKAACTGKPLIISTGMAGREEIAEAVATARGAGARQVALLHCTSAYPAPPEESNLRTITDLAERFDVVAGLSDHTEGTIVPVAAIALGAAIIEKHFTLRRSDGGPDAAFSLEPDELSHLTAACRTAWEALGRIVDGPTETERSYLQFRRSLYAVRDIERGERFTAANVRAIRPGYGLAPKHLSTVLEGRATRAVERGTPLARDMVDVMTAAPKDGELQGG